MQKYLKSDNVAVIYSPDYGRGWYTLHETLYPVPERLLFDSILVKILIERDEKLLHETDQEYRVKVLNDAQKKFQVRLNELFEDSGNISFDIEDLEIGWVSKNKEFVIKEYDGCESIHLKENVKWLKA